VEGGDGIFFLVDWMIWKMAVEIMKKGMHEEDKMTYNKS
jgi:hypothetical protein